MTTERMNRAMSNVCVMRVFTVWLMMAILIPAIKAEISEQKASIQEVFEKGEIGTAISFKRDANEMKAITEKHATSSKSRIERYRRLLVHPEGYGNGGGYLGRIARSLKYANGCSESSNDVSAIIECTNAVRANPDAFAKDYPCDYQSWRGEVAGRNLVRLVTGPVIQRLAQLHTDDQARMNSMTHTGSDGSNLQTRADRVQLPWGAVGENVAVGFTSAKAVVMAWMCSPPHRKNLMSCDFSKIGIGTGVSQQGRNYYTQVFSCDISEKCGCNKPNKPRTPAPKVKRTTKVEKHRTPSRPNQKSETKGVSHTRQPPRRSPSPPPQTRSHQGHSASSSSSSYSQGGSASSSASASAGNHCAWINRVWTCGSNVHAAQNDPYGIHSGRR